MDSFKKRHIIVGILFILLKAMPIHSQITFDDDVDDTTPAAPIDGLIGLGIAVGAFYGVKKLKNNISLNLKEVNPLD
jgi:hypothetical protein